MNKRNLVEQEIEKNRQRFGRWASTTKKDSADPVKLLFFGSPQNEEEALQHGNALAATGNYPVGTDGCFNVGISGGCGVKCYVYQEGDCGEPQEMVPLLIDMVEIARHNELYGTSLKGPQRQEKTNE